ncbi:MAG: RluA family pseudouridine synthase [Acidobacteria bacterium]|nr:RluA family pseudouridine synthase [Acidobacteriota bacterium]
MPSQSSAQDLQIFTFVAETKGLRFDQFLALHFPAISLTRLRAAIKQGEARINGKTSFSGWILKAGDEITIQLDPDSPTSAMPEKIPLEILFEDDDLLVINKQTGLLSHPSHKEKSGTLMNAVAWHFLHSTHQPGKTAPRPILLHRLDRDTSGVIAIAKTERASRIVSKAFRERRVKKSYLALVQGVVAEETGTIDASIGCDPHGWPRWKVLPEGDPSQTNFTVKQRFAHHTLLELEPLTGRTHQLRIHCAHLGHPIVGDQVYRRTTRAESEASTVKKKETAEITMQPEIKVKHQLLHAHSLTFRHPTTNEDVCFLAPLPTEMAQIIQRLSSP